jgi:hypothetical protein
MTGFGIAAAIVAIVVLTARQAWLVGGSRSQRPAGAPARRGLPQWVDVAIAVAAVVVLLPRLWELLT